MFLLETTSADGDVEWRVYATRLLRALAVVQLCNSPVGLRFVDPRG